MKVKIWQWNGVASWLWVANDDNCGICRVAFNGCCPDCKVPGDDCPLVWGQCSHCFHMHCILKWLNSQQVQQQCPMCRQEWKFKEWHWESNFCWREAICIPLFVCLFVCCCFFIKGKPMVGSGAALLGLDLFAALKMKIEGKCVITSAHSDHSHKPPRHYHSTEWVISIWYGTT